MSIEEFTEAIEKALTQELGAGYRTKICNVMKENDSLNHGIAIVKGDENMAPTLYVDAHYEDYVKGRVSIPQVIKKLLRVYRYTLENPVGISSAINLTSFDVVRDKVCMYLVNKDLNTEWLEDTVHTDFLDLAIAFKIVFTLEEGLASIRVSTKVFECWDISVDELYEIALQNSIKLMPEVVRPLEEIVRERGHRVPGGFDLYVATNKTCSSGAGVILYPGVLKNLATELNSDLFILPSSRHEVIVVPEETAMDVCALREMVNEVNTNEITRDDLLSFNVYKYVRETDKVVIA